MPTPDARAQIGRQAAAVVPVVRPMNECAFRAKSCDRVIVGVVVACTRPWAAARWASRMETVRVQGQSEPVDA